jgi:hypothetical protein
MNSLPAELNLKILHHVRDSTPTLKSSSNTVASMRQGNAYNEFLLLMALYHRRWTAVAQSELFHHIILVNEDKTQLLLKLLSEEVDNSFRTYAHSASSIILGRFLSRASYEGWKDQVDELAQYCPNIVDISCAYVNTNFSDFRELSPLQLTTEAQLNESWSWRRAENIKRLDRLNLYRGFQRGSSSFSLSITNLSLESSELSEPLDPISFPVLTHLFFDCLYGPTSQSVLPLLPRITSLTIGESCSQSGESCSQSQIDRMLSASTSLTTISISSSDFVYLDDGSCNVIKERLEMIRVTRGRYRVDFSKLADCITGSTVLKKVILDGLTFVNVSGQVNEIAELKKVVEACKKKKTVELWKVNFIVNGKVDLDADVVSFLPSYNPWIAPHEYDRYFRRPRLICHESALL